MSNTALSIEDVDPGGDDDDFGDFCDFVGLCPNSNDTNPSNPEITFSEIYKAMGFTDQDVSKIEQDFKLLGEPLQVSQIEQDLELGEDPLPMNYEEDEYWIINLDQSPDDSAVDNPILNEIIKSLSDVNDITPTISLEEIVEGWPASHSTSPTTVAHPLFGMDPDIPCQVDRFPIPDLPRSKTPETTKSVSQPVFFSDKTVPEDRKRNSKRKHEQVETNSADDRNAKRKKVETNSNDDRNAKRKKIGAYTPEQRKAKIANWMAKRSKRIWMKRVKYDVRKNFADSRLRAKGRFVKKEDEELLRELMNLT